MDAKHDNIPTLYELAANMVRLSSIYVNYARYLLKGPNSTVPCKFFGVFIIRALRRLVH
jgi:hypothetical protein